MAADSNQEVQGGGFTPRETSGSDDSSSDTNEESSRKRSREEDSESPPPGLVLQQLPPASSVTPTNLGEVELKGLETLKLNEERAPTDQEPECEPKEAKHDGEAQKPNLACASVRPKEEPTELEPSGGNTKRLKATLPKHLTHFEHMQLTEVEYGMLEDLSLTVSIYGDQNVQYAEGTYVSGTTCNLLPSEKRNSEPEKIT